MKKILLGISEYFLVVSVVTSCLLLGRYIHQFVALLPPSLYGMLLFALVLSVGNTSGFLPEKLFHAPMAVILRFLSFVFVPVSVGVMQYGDLILKSGGKIILVGVVTTLSLITIVGGLSKILLGDKVDV